MYRYLCRRRRDDLNGGRLDRLGRLHERSCRRKDGADVALRANNFYKTWQKNQSRVESDLGFADSKGPFGGFRFFQERIYRLAEGKLVTFDKIGLKSPLRSLIILIFHPVPAPNLQDGRLII